MDRGGGQHTLIGKIIARKGMRLMDFMEESGNFIAMKRFLCGDACGHPMSWSKLQAHHCWQKPHLYLQNVRKLTPELGSKPFSAYHFDFYCFVISGGSYFDTDPTCL